MRNLILTLLCAFMLFAGCSSKEVVVIYSPHGADMLGDYEKLFEAAHPEVDMQWLDLGSSEVLGRVRAEQGRPMGDVWWGAPSTMFTQAAQEGLLDSYTPTWADAVELAYHDSGDAWYGTFISPLAIMYNTRGLSEADIPKTWNELLNPEWKDKIALRMPLPSGTMRTFISAMISRAEDEATGLKWLKQLHEATAEYPENPAMLYDHIKKNEDRISVWIQPDIVLQRDRNQFPFGYFIPPQTPVLTDGIAIIKGAPHGEWAKKFYEFVTTEEALVQQAAEYAKLPARSDVDRNKLPEWMQSVEIDAMAIDWAVFSAKQDEWCSRWDNEVYKAAQ